MHLDYGFAVRGLIQASRRFEPMHRFFRWLRRNFWQGLVEAWIEFLRLAFANSKRFGPPTTLVSVYQILRSGVPPMRGRIVLEDQGTPKVTPDSLMPISGYQQHLHQPWAIFWSHHPNASLVSSSLALADGKTLCLESVYQDRRARIDPAWRAFRRARPVHLSGNWTSLVSLWVQTDSRPNWTHWLLDALPRLAVLGEFPPDTRILVPASLFESQKQSLSLLGLLDRCRPTKETHLTVENYYFSSPTAMLECYNPYGIEFLRSSFLPKRDPKYTGPKKFFVTRTGSVRNPADLQTLNDFFSSIGWGLIQPADLTFAQQIKLFSEAEAVCGIVGSGLTNTVFCSPGCQVILLAQDFMPDSWLEWISQVIKAEFRFQICRTDHQQKIQPDIRVLRGILQSLGHQV